MHCCQASLPLTMAEYEALPDRDGIISDRAMDAYECGRPAVIRHNGTWFCANHYDAVCRGERLIQEHENGKAIQSKKCAVLMAADH
jgi:hypothetical protein